MLRKGHRKPQGASGVSDAPSAHETAADAKAERFARAYGSDERVQWIRNQPCLACGKGPCENAHVKSGGMGRKADAEWVIPLCSFCHREMHAHGQQTFQTKYRLVLDVWAGIIDDRWHRHLLATEAP